MIGGDRGCEGRVAGPLASSVQLCLPVIPVLEG